MYTVYFRTISLISILLFLYSWPHLSLSLSLSLNSDTVSLNKTFAISPPSLESSPNIILLPYEPHPLRYKSENMIWTKLNAPDSFISFTESLRNQVFGLPKREGKKGQVSEKDW